MRKLTLLLVLLPLISIAFAQENSSDKKFFLGGSVHYSSEKNNAPHYGGLYFFGGIPGISGSDTKSTSFWVAPYFGREINSHIMIGVRLVYQNEKFEDPERIVFGPPVTTTELERTANQISAGVISRYTINPQKSFNLYLQPYAEYNVIKEKQSENSVITFEQDAQFVEVGIGIGVMYNISDRWRATLSATGIHFLSGKWEDEDSNKEKDFSLFGTNLNLNSLAVGIELLL